MQTSHTAHYLGSEAESLLTYTCQKIPASLVLQPSLAHMNHVFAESNRSQAVQASMHRLYNHGRLGGSGYLSVFPVDQGLEHTAAYSFYQNPAFFDPDAICKMALEGGCSAVTSSVGALGMIAKKYADKVPLIVKLNHSEHLTLPEKTDQLLFASIQQAHQMGAIGVGATIYFGSPESHRQIELISQAIEQAHNLGMFAMIWCYPRNPNYQTHENDFSESVDITAQAIHIAVSMGADIVKQKMPTPTYGFKNLNFSKWHPDMYQALLGTHEIDLVRYQVLHAYAGKIGLLNSGGEAAGSDDMKTAIRSAVINKRAGGQGIVMGRKVFKKPWDDGLKLLWAVQDVYLDQSITLA